MLHVAYVGTDISSSVRAGENAGKELIHDFVVLNLSSYSGRGNWTLELPEVPAKGQQRTALVVWLTPIDSLRVIQAVGGFLDQPT